MNRPALISAVAGLVIGIAGTLAATPFLMPHSSASKGHDMTGPVDHGPDMSGMSAASRAYMEAMAAMSVEMEAMAMTGRPGTDFARMMIPHHQSAIDMAVAYLASEDQDPAIAKLAQEIVAAQETEISFLRAWLAKQKM